MRSWWKTIIITTAEGLPYLRFSLHENLLSNSQMKADRQTLIDQFQVPHDPLQTSTLSHILALPPCYHKQGCKLQNRETHLHTRTEGINYFGTVKKVIMRRKQEAKRASKSRACQMVVSNTYNRSSLLKL
jgi:hypothetical protein